MDLFDDDPAHEPLQVENRECTPEALLEFVYRAARIDGRVPTLHECKGEFGGILGPLVSMWELDRRGVWELAMKLKSAQDVIAVARNRGLTFRVDPGPPVMPILVRPANVRVEQVTEALMAALKAWRLEIIDELTRQEPVGAE